MLSNALARISGGRLTLLRLALLATALLYLPTTNFQFVYDDLPQIVYNSRLHDWDSLPRYFTESTWGPTSVVYQYRPLFLLWFRLNYLLFELSPAGWHLSTLAAHLLAACLVGRVVRKVTMDEDVAGLTALFFGILPVHMEATVWISAVSESLYVIPSLGALLLYLDYMNDLRRNRVVAAAALFGVALLAKETALAVLPIIAGCALFLHRGPESGKPSWQARCLRLAAGLWPFVLVAALYFVARGYALRSFTHFPHPNPWPEVLLSLPHLAWYYARLLFWPFSEHSQFYSVGIIQNASANGFWLPLVGVLGLLAGFLYWAKHSKLGVLATLCLVFPLLPPLAGVRGFRLHDLVHDRYLYLPAFAVCALLATGFSVWMNRAGRGSWRAAPLVALVAVVGFFSVRVLREQKIYHDDISLYRRATEAVPESATVWNFMGYAYARDGKRLEAIRAHERALSLGPGVWETHDYLGDIYFESGDTAKAEGHLRRAATLRVGADRSSALFKLGLTLARQQKYSEAETAFREALTLAPARSGYHFSLGQALRRQRRFAEAAAEFEREIELHQSAQAKQALAEMAAEGSARR